MKIVTLIISILATGLLVFNITRVDFSNPLKGDSMVAIITIVASLCVILMMIILRLSKQIEKKVKARR